MRILHSIHSVNPELGGPSEFVRSLLPLAGELGDEMAVACMDNPQESFVKNFPGKIFPFAPAMAGYGYAPQYAHWLAANKDKYDAVIVHGLWQYPGLATQQALRRSSIPYVVFAHGMLDPWFKKFYPLRHLKKSIYWLLAEHSVLHDAKAVLFTSQTEADDAGKTFQPFDIQPVVIGLGTTRPAGDPLVQQAALYRDFPRLQGKTIILYLGRLHEKKGCDLLLTAFAKVILEYPQILHRYPDLHLVMAGSGEADYQAHLKQHAERQSLHERITWTGFISGEQKFGALHAASALILPSHQENFAIVVAEALACGTPVLISNRVNIWQDIAQAGVGLVDEDNLGGAKRLLVNWLSLSEGEQEQKRQNAKRCFEQKFEVHRVYDRLISLLNGFIESANE